MRNRARKTVVVQTPVLLKEFDSKWVKFTCFYKFVCLNKIKIKTYKKLRLLRSPRELGSWPLKMFPDRSRVWSFWSFPIESGIGPKIALFCSVLQKYIELSIYIKIIIVVWYLVKNKSNWKTYIDCKLLRFPIADDNVPDKFWLGSPLVKNQNP